MAAAARSINFSVHGIVYHGEHIIVTPLVAAADMTKNREIYTLHNVFNSPVGGGPV